MLRRVSWDQQPPQPPPAASWPPASQVPFAEQAPPWYGPAAQQVPPWHQPPWQPGLPAYAAAPPPRTDGFARTALILGIVPLLGGVLGVLFGSMALLRIRRDGSRGKGMAITGIVAGSVWILVFAGVAIAVVTHPTRDSAGHVTATRTLDLKEVKIGDCVAKQPASPVRNITVMPCRQAHIGEVFDVNTMSGGTFPGVAAVDSYVSERCRRLLPLYVKAKAGETGYGIYYVAPSSQSWSLGRRIVVCMLHSKTGHELTGSSKGAGVATA